MIETVIDDSNPQLLAYVSELLLEAGAWDVYRAAVQMKKGRTGVQLTVLCQARTVPAMRELLLARDHDHRVALAHGKQDGPGARVCGSANPVGQVRIKIARWPAGEVANASPEYEDCRSLRPRSTPCRSSR